MLKVGFQPWVSGNDRSPGEITDTSNPEMPWAVWLQAKTAFLEHNAGQFQADTDLFPNLDGVREDAGLLAIQRGSLRDSGDAGKGEDHCHSQEKWSHDGTP